MKNELEQVLGRTTKAVLRGGAGRQAAKVVGRQVGKQAGKAVLRTASSPWLLVADATQLAAEKVARELDCDEGTARNVGRGAGLATSVAVGAAVGGPVGAVAGAALFGVGELVGSLFD